MSEDWALATEAAGVAGVSLRPLTSPSDAAAIREVVAATWGKHDLLPSEMVIALGESGNVTWGAFDDGRLVGFVLSWAGVSPADGLHIHSHQLAALPDRRHNGIGYALKLAQRAQALDQGITLVRWTFDPLVSRNAWFNLVKLGASADRFLPHFYGEMTDSLNTGEASDRLLIRWKLDRVPPGEPREAAGVKVLARAGPDDRPEPGTPADPPAEGPAMVEVPREYHDLRSRDPELAAAWRRASSSALTACFDAGFVVTGFTAGSTYVLERHSR